ncbi:hypothetical protein [Sphingomonas sp. BAUL-RG-20F-R05-02]|uniref:hypothetical protein n=1 Tax=Sphingomonas sp. BAUL-RG-20F-R05-02 TaxID=2914830 RepID=UPI001F55BF1F|nr:hypothetical protein [Sphingomonas sp. BAUL-RG-20F-R05-02]
MKNEFKNSTASTGTLILFVKEKGGVGSTSSLTRNWSARTKAAPPTYGRLADMVAQQHDAAEAGPQ